MPGATVSHISDTTGCTVKLSNASSHFPGTNDRVIVMWGKLRGLQAAFVLIIVRFLSRVHRIALSQHVNSVSVCLCVCVLKVYTWTFRGLQHTCVGKDTRRLHR